MISSPVRLFFCSPIVRPSNRLFLPGGIFYFTLNQYNANTLTGNRKYEHRVHDAAADVYRYDGIYQVSGVKFGVPSADVSSTNEWDDYDTWDVKHEWEFDAVGNRESMDRDGTTEYYNRVSGSYVSDPMNEYYNVGGVTQTHDANGNLTDDGTNSFTYDYANHLMKVTRDSDSAVLGEYKYAADGRRLERVVGSAAQRYYWWGWQLAETRDGSANVIETHVWGVWIDDLLTSDLGTSATRYYFLDNAIGSVCQATDTNGAVVEEYKYTDTFGKVAFYSCSDSGGSRTLTSVSATQIGNRHLFTGREWDDEAGLYQYRCRAMSPDLGRFSQRDPVFVDRRLSRYSYVMNCAVRMIDPYGLYGRDVHHDMTDRLAVDAGMSQRDADAIANADNAEDALFGIDSAPFNSHPLDLIASFNHFWPFCTTQIASTNLERLISNCGQDLAAFGGWLHFYQDSFAHEGYTIPFGHMFANMSGHSPDDETDSPKYRHMRDGTFLWLSLLSQHRKNKKGVYAAAMPSGSKTTDGDGTVDGGAIDPATLDDKLDWIYDDWAARKIVRDATEKARQGANRSRSSEEEPKDSTRDPVPPDEPWKHRGRGHDKP